MLYTSLPVMEEKVFLTGNNNEFSFTKIAVPVPGESLTLEGQLCTPRGRSQYYYAISYPKERIVLHHTAGQIRSDLEALTRNQYHVSVAFVIARSGMIYQLFSSKFWSGHIGKGLGNTDTGNAQDKVTIGIELSNYGFLLEREGHLETCYSRSKDKNGNIGPVDVYCSLREDPAYEKLDKPFRGESYYATFTEAQYQSLVILLRYLTKQYNIPRQFLPEKIRYQTTEQVLTFRGIVSHINYRKDGKWDLGPVFQWKKVMEGLTAPTFIPASIRGGKLNKRSVTPDKFPVITAEDQIDSKLPEPIDPMHENDSYDN